MWRDKVRAAAKRKPRKPVLGRATVRCGKCGKRYANPLAHVCSGGGGLKRKRAVADRRAKAAERRARETAARQARAAERRTKEAAARRARRAREDAARRARRQKERERSARKRRPASGPRKPSHRYQQCKDAECARPPCLAYREGYGEGFADGAASAAGS